MICCLEFFVPLENFSLIWRRHHDWWRAANFNLCSALMVIEQSGFVSMPHLMWHGASVYMVISVHPWHSHLYCREFGSGAATTCFYDWGLSRMEFEHPTFRLRGEGSNPLRHRFGLIMYIMLTVAIGNPTHSQKRITLNYL